MKLKMPDGNIVDAKIMSFEPVREDWNTYKLQDGTMMKVKIIPANVYRLKATDPVTGQHLYYVQHSVVVSTIEPEKEE